MANPVPPAKPDWHCLTKLLPQDQMWVYICLKGACGGCCQSIQAQFWYNPCLPPVPEFGSNPVCDLGHSAFYVPVPFCDDITNACQILWVPWYEVCKWSPLDLDVPCGSPSPSNIPCGGNQSFAALPPGTHTIVEVPR